MSTQITGYAAVFDSETTIVNAFREVIKPGAFRETLARDDIRSLFNHDPNIVLGRMSANTVELHEDTKGLRYTVTINEADPLAAAVMARVARKDITGSSFWFGVDSPNDEEWQAGGRGQLPLRVLYKLRLVDVGPVSFPAYVATTSVVVRGVTAAIAHRQALRAAIDRARAVRP